MDAALDGRTVSLERPFGTHRGQRLTLRNVLRGARVYLCIENGFADLSLPGQPLRCLKPGDELQVQSGAIAAAKSLGDEGALRTAPLHRMAPAESSCVLRVVLGPQDDHFSATGKQVFFSSEYRVSAQSDRRGIRLEGPAIALERVADIPPEGTAPGAIQVPGTGLPIILGPDRPVTGGYAKIATVIGADLSQLAQARPGSRVRFQAVTMAEAIAARGG
jgi:allophanate hydrolase subunit 2